MCRGYGGIAGIEARVFEGTFAYTVVGPVNGKGWVPYIESVEYPPNLWLMPFDLALIISDAWCVRPVLRVRSISRITLGLPLK